MILYLVPVAVIILSLFIIFFIVAKKLPELAAINVSSIKTERDSKVKNRIIAQRLGRKFFDFKNILKKFLTPLAEKIRSVFTSLYQTIMNLEKIRTRQASPLKSIDISQEVNDSLAKAKEFIEQENFDQAENLYIKVIELDRSNVEAYSGLVEVYLEKKDYKKARETCRYCLKLLNKASKNAPANGQKHQVAELCADLGSIYQLEEKYDQAITSFNKSLELEPNNPRFLDLLLKISIIVKRKDLAISTFKILKKADPDNQKLVELKSEVDAIEPEQL